MDSPDQPASNAESPSDDMAGDDDSVHPPADVDADADSDADADADADADSDAARDVDADADASADDADAAPADDAASSDDDVTHDGEDSDADDTTDASDEEVALGDELGDLVEGYHEREDSIDDFLGRVESADLSDDDLDRLVDFEEENKDRKGAVNGLHDLMDSDDESEDGGQNGE